MGIIPTGKEKGFYLRSWEIFPQIPSGSSSVDAPNPKREKQEKYQKNRKKIPEKKEKNPEKEEI